MKRKVLLVLLVVLLCSQFLFAGGRSAGGTSAQGKVVTLLVDKDFDLSGTEAVMRAIESQLGIRTEVEVRMGGTEGDNIVKTRLATGSMSDIFIYNTGSLFQALNPSQTLYDITNEPYTASISDDFKNAVTLNGRVYGAPQGSTMAGAILYNKAIYRELGLSVPHTWNDFIANCEKIQAAGKTAVIASLRDTWTSQLYLLGDNYNVKAAYPTWPQDYTANRAKYATTPAALRGFQKTADIRPYLNRDYLATNYDQAVEKLAMGEGAHWAMLTQALSSVANAYPNKIDDIGVFGVPGDNPNNHGITVWTSNGIYINKNSPQLELAKQWVAFYVSQEGLRIYSQARKPDGPFSIKNVTLPDTVYEGVKEMQPYFNQGRADVALEFESPIKGPNLEQILVEVMTGSMTPAQAAALYDEDVAKQAIQLGISGW